MKNFSFASHWLGRVCVHDNGLSPENFTKKTYVCTYLTKKKNKNEIKIFVSYNINFKEQII